MSTANDINFNYKHTKSKFISFVIVLAIQVTYSWSNINLIFDLEGIRESSVLGTMSADYVRVISFIVVLA